MIIVFLQVLYFIGKMVLNKYKTDKHKDDEFNVKDSCSPALVDLSNKRQKTNDPLEDDYEEGPSAPRFSPPAYIQRYLAVAKVLADPRYKKKIKKVVDFGCSELGFVVYLKNTPGIEEIVCVDIDRETLERFKYKAIPLNVDYLQKRPQPLTIDVYEGSISHRDERLAKSDAVVAIELIEHLYPDDLTDFPYNVFGFIKPLVVVVTTPNADFNVLFPNMKDKFRHWDHKFEWTRLQFMEWAYNIVSRYPEYEVSFAGIGPGPEGTEELGCCSQMAIFSKVRTLELERISGARDLLKTVIHEEFPHFVDNRSDERKILDEANYYLRQCTLDSPEPVESFPLGALMKKLETLKNISITEEVLREILSDGGWLVVDDGVTASIILPENSHWGDDDEEFMSNEDYYWPDLQSNSPNDDDSYSGDWRGDMDNIEADYEESWDDIDIPAHMTSADVVSSNVDNDRAPRVELLFSRSINTSDFEGIEVANASQVQSSFDSFERLSSTVPTVESSDFESPQVTEDESSYNTATNGQTSYESVDSRTPKISKITPNTSCNGELASVCSIFLESSRNNDVDVCPQITDSSFDCTELQRSFEASIEIRAAENSSMVSNSQSQHFSPRHSSSRMDDGRQSTSSTSVIDSARWEQDQAVSERSTTERGSVMMKFDKNVHTKKTTESKIQKTASVPENVSEEVGLSRSTDSEMSVCTIHSERQKTPGNLSLRSTTNPMDERESRSKLSEEKSREIKRKRAASPEGVETPSNSWSPEVMDSGYPNSSSMQDTTPEYDLSSIAQDRISDSESPSVEEAPHPGFLERAEVENGDLANNNRDDEGNNYAAVLPEDEDLEGDLQPLIDVLEHDIENENDIYALENDFPIWLLRILQRGNPHRLNGLRDLPEEPGYAGFPEFDEGFDSSESESQYDDEDDRNFHIDNVEVVSTGSSEETMD